MTERTVFLRKPHSFSYFRQQPFVGLVQEVRCVSRIRRTKAPSEGGPHFFMTIYFSGRVEMTVGFDDEKAAVTARRDLIVQLMNYFGADQVVFSNGFYSEVAVVPAIQSLTDIYDKDRRAGFSAILIDTPVPLHFVCPDYSTAQTFHQTLFNKIEAYRRSVPTELPKAVNV